MDWREEIPTSGKRAPDWGEDIPTPGHRASVLGHKIPTWGWCVPDSGQVFQSHQRPPFILERTGLDGDRPHHGRDDSDYHLEHLLHC